MPLPGRDDGWDEEDEEEKEEEWGRREPPPAPPAMLLVLLLLLPRLPLPPLVLPERGVEGVGVGVGMGMGMHSERWDGEASSRRTCST